jgi:hypothetical protein
MESTKRLVADEPSAADLAAIEREMPLIEAEIDLVDAEIRMATVDRPSELDWRRLRALPPTCGCRTPHCVPPPRPVDPVRPRRPGRVRTGEPRRAHDPRNRMA